MKFKPVSGRVLVEREETKLKTPGGLFIPENTAEKPLTGKIVSSGGDIMLEDGSIREMEVKKGDKVLFGSYSGTEIEIEGSPYLILREDDIVAIIHE